jgi:hypothetical protein
MDLARHLLAGDEAEDRRPLPLGRRRQIERTDDVGRHLDGNRRIKLLLDPHATLVIPHVDVANRGMAKELRQPLHDLRILPAPGRHADSVDVDRLREKRILEILIRPIVADNEVTASDQKAIERRNLRFYAFAVIRSRLVVLHRQ